MRHHDDQHDALNDYLDSLADTPSDGSLAENLDPALRDGVDRFLGLAEQAGMRPGTSTQPRRSTMNATLPASTPLPIPRRKPRRRLTPPAWTRHLHLLSTGLLIVAVIALTYAVFSANGPGGGGGGDDSGNFATVPFATVPDDAETSSIPYPTTEECTVEPMTREELVTHLEEANTATAPEFKRYERAIEPTQEESEAIMAAYRQWQACSVGGINVAAQLELQTPWYTANSLPVFYNYQTGAIERPINDDEIQEYADILLTGNDHAAIAQVTAVAATPPSEEATQSGLPIPADATPFAFEGGRSFPTIFAEDIVITGPDTAYAKVYFVNQNNGEISPDSPSVTYGFVKVDGQWLIDSYREGIGG